MKAAVQYREAIFVGATHDDAIAKLAQRFPHYREFERKSDPVIRGWKNADGAFMNLLQVARSFQ